MGKQFFGKGNLNNNNIVPQNANNTPSENKLEENDDFNEDRDPFADKSEVITQIIPPKKKEDKKNENQLSLIKENEDENEGEKNQIINNEPFNVEESETVVQDNQPNQVINKEPFNVEEVETVVQDNQPNQIINKEPFNVEEVETVVQDNQINQPNQPINTEPFNVEESETVVQDNQPIINTEPFSVEESETIVQNNKPIDNNPFDGTPEENTILEQNLENNDPFGNVEETGTIIGINHINKQEHIPKKENQILEIKEEKNEEENINSFNIAQYDVEYKMDNSDMIEKENDTGIIPVPLMSDIIRRDYLGNDFRNIVSIPDIISPESDRLRSRPNKTENDKKNIAENQEKIFNLLNSGKTNNSSINNSEKSAFDSIQNSGNFNVVTNSDDNK